IVLHKNSSNSSNCGKEVLEKLLTDPSLSIQTSNVLIMATRRKDMKSRKKVKDWETLKKTKEGRLKRWRRQKY
ncbi:22649_t:CDS:1, partial [Gigaspora rosea]